MPYIIFYTVTLMISIMTMCAAMAHRFKQGNFYYPLMFLMMGISNGGYLALCVSTTLEKALLAHKVFDIAGAFLMPLLFLCVLELCHIETTFGTRMSILCINMLIYFLDLSVGHTGLYYATQYITRHNGYTQLVFTTGPLYFLFPLQLILYASAIIGISIYCYLRRKTVSFKSLTYLTGMVILSISIYLSKIIFKYEVNFIPLAYAIGGVILILLLKRLGLYDLSSNLTQSTYLLDISGYVLFDDNMAFLTKSESALAFCPELEQAHVDYPLPNLVENFAKMNSWLSELRDSDEEAIIHFQKQGDRELKCTTARILLDSVGKHKSYGYLITIADVTDERRYLNLMAKYNEELKRDVENETRHVKEVQEKLILGMANMIENRDNNTGGHIKRTSRCIEIIAEELRRRDKNNVVTEQFCAALVKAAPMHDIGKIAVDDDILKKPGRFTEDEYEQMKQHAAKGADLLMTIIENVEDAYFIEIAENMAHYHHERWNGTGYPENLTGDKIPLEARIMALADVYDALVSERCYKPKLSFDQAAEIIRNGMGTHFDPALAEVFEACRPQLEAYYSNDED